MRGYVGSHSWSTGKILGNFLVSAKLRLNSGIMTLLRVVFLSFYEHYELINTPTDGSTRGMERYSTGNIGAMGLEMNFFSSSVLG